MATSGITLKRSAVPGKVPTTANLSLGELALNTHDGILYFKKDDGVAEEVLALSPMTSGVVYSVKTANYSAADKDGILADTTAGSFTITLPETPTAGMQVYIADPNSWETNPVIVSPGAGISIESFAPGEDLALDVVGALCTFVYSGTKWKLYLTPGPEGISGSGGDVVGPEGAADGEVVLFDGASGKLVKSGGVLGTGAFVAEDKWAIKAFSVMASRAPAAPTFALDSYYPNSNVQVANGHTAVRGNTGDIYTLTDGVWVLTDPFNFDGIRVVTPLYGTINNATSIYIRIAGVTTQHQVRLDSGSVMYSEGSGATTVMKNIRTKLNEIGLLSDLSTTNRTSIVEAINEVLTVANRTGDLNQLTTTAKTSSVAAINELVSAKVNKSGDTLTGALNWAAPVTIASAATVDLSTTTSNRVRVTGTTTITSLGTIVAGACRTVTFAGGLTLTHNATSLVLPGGANITTAAGDVAEFESLGSGNWRCTSYMRASGQAVVSPAMPTLQSLNRNTYLRETNNGTLVTNGRYGIWTGGGAVTMNMPALSNCANGDEILLGNLHHTWGSTAFTINCPANVVFRNPAGANESQLVCNTNNLQGIRLYCVWNDGSQAAWNVLF